MRVSIQGLHVETDARPFPRIFVIQGKGINTKMIDLQPAVAHRAGGQQLDGIRETLDRFRNGVVQDAFRQGTPCHFHHISADDDPGGHMAMKILYHGHKGIVIPLSDPHACLH